MPEKTTVVYVEWVDAHGGSGQFNLEEIQRSKIDYMASAGIFVSEDEAQIVFVQDSFRMKERQPQVRDYEIIPKVNIIRVLRWEVANV